MKAAVMVISADVNSQRIIRINILTVLLTLYMG